MVATYWVLAAILGWVLVAVAYAHGLRRVLEAREAAVQHDLLALADAVAAWRDLLDGLGQREWRERAAGLDQALAVLRGHQPLDKKLAAGAEIGRLIRDQKEALARSRSMAAVRGAQRAAQVERALRRLSDSAASYGAAAADAGFARARFPLSLLSRSVGLGRPKA